MRQGNHSVRHLGLEMIRFSRFRKDGGREKLQAYRLAKFNGAMGRQIGFDHGALRSYGDLDSSYRSHSPDSYDGAIQFAWRSFKACHFVRAEKKVDRTIRQMIGLEWQYHSFYRHLPP